MGKKHKKSKEDAEEEGEKEVKEEAEEEKGRDVGEVKEGAEEESREESRKGKKKKRAEKVGEEAVNAEVKEEGKSKKRKKSDVHEGLVEIKEEGKAKRKKSEGQEGEGTPVRKIKSEIKDEIKEENKKHHYYDKASLVCEIANPLASKALAKRLYKLIWEATHHKTYLRHGLKDVQNKITKKGEKGIVVFAGDVSPIDVMCHLPIVCEELQLPYVFTPSRQDLGAAMGVKRGCLIVLIREHEDYKSLYEEVFTEVESMSEAAKTLYSTISYS